MQDSVKIHKNKSVFFLGLSEYLVRLLLIVFKENIIFLTAGDPSQKFFIIVSHWIRVYCLKIFDQLTEIISTELLRSHPSYILYIEAEDIHISLLLHTSATCQYLPTIANLNLSAGR